jgi:oligopeptide transport system ATP-binding protein
MGVLMITHDLGIVGSMCDHIAVMYGGRVVEYGTADDIFYNPQHEYTKGLLRSIPKLEANNVERLVPIKGTPIDMINPPPGCPFAPRCDSCMQICMEKMPPFKVFSENHASACWVCISDQQKQAAGVR